MRENVLTFMQTILWIDTSLFISKNMEICVKEMCARGKVDTKPKWFQKYGDFFVKDMYTRGRLGNKPEWFKNMAIKEMYTS